MFTDGDVIHHHHDEAPGKDHQARDGRETLELAEQLRAEARGKLGAKKKEP